MNEVATGIAGTETALGALPGGSTNVFARTIGLPNDPVEAVDLLANGIDAADLQPIGLGRANGRYFCFHTGVGYDAAVVAAVERHAPLKRWLGHPMFITAAVLTWTRGYSRREPHFRVVTDGRRGRRLLLDRPEHEPVHLPRQPAARPSHAATFDRGLVAVTFRTMRATAIVRSLIEALRGGVKPEAWLDEQIDLQHLVIEHERPFPYQLDGDYLGEVT